MKKYLIEVNEEQLRLISQCVEDCHRFASGETELSFTVGNGCYETNKDNIKNITDHLNDIKNTCFWGNASLGYNATSWLGNTYAIYREILHFFNKDGDNVYSRPTLKSGNQGSINITVKTN